VDSEWQPIKTAPKDGTKILVYDGFDITTVYWGMSNWNLVVTEDWATSSLFEDATHWMLLPVVPK